MGCQRFFYYSRDPLLKKVNFFLSGVFLGRAEDPGLWSRSDCPIAHSTLVHACVLSLLFFLFFFIGGQEGRYFPLPPRVSIYLVAPLGLWFPDPNANPNPSLKSYHHHNFNTHLLDAHYKIYNDKNNPNYPNNTNPNSKPNPNPRLYSGNYHFEKLTHVDCQSKWLCLLIEFAFGFSFQPRDIKRPLFRKQISS